MLKVIVNTDEALKLAEQYEAINEDEITETANDLWYEGVYLRLDMQNKTATISGGSVLRRLTGFGNSSSCKLCRAVGKVTRIKTYSEGTVRFQLDDKHPDCDECLYRLALSQYERMTGSVDLYYCTRANSKAICGATLATSYSSINRFELKVRLAWDDNTSRHELIGVENAVQLRDLIRFRAMQIRGLIEYEENKVILTKATYKPNPYLNEGGENV